MRAGLTFSCHSWTRRSFISTCIAHAARFEARAASSDGMCWSDDGVCRSDDGVCSSDGMDRSGGVGAGIRECICAARATGVSVCLFMVAADVLRFGSSVMCSFVSAICADANVTETNARNSSAVPYRAASLDREDVFGSRGGDAAGAARRALGELGRGLHRMDHARLATERDLDIITVAV